MHSMPFVSIMISAPIIGSIFVYLCSKKYPQNIKHMSLWTSFVTFVIACIFTRYFDFSVDGLQFVEQYKWIPSYNIFYKVGLDKFSVLFSLFISFLCFLLSIFALKKSISKQFLISMFFFESFAIGAFCSYDLFLLLFFMEATIIPVFMMISHKNTFNERSVIYQYLIYSMLSAVLLLISFVIIYVNFQTSDISVIYKSLEKVDFKSYIGFWILFIGIGIKMPIFPFYYWLLTVHVKSSTILSVIFASIILKFSSLVILRVLVPVFPQYLTDNSGILSGICILGAIFACAYIVRQDDLKRLFACFSILHMNLYFLMLLSGIGQKYYIFSLLQHSVVIAVVFLSTNIIKSFYHTRSIAKISSGEKICKNINVYLLYGILALMGCPGFFGFISEILTVYSSFKLSFYVSIPVLFVVIISSSYAFLVYCKFFKNKSCQEKEDVSAVFSIDKSKKICIVMLLIIAIVVGIYPNLILNMF